MRGRIFAKLPNEEHRALRDFNEAIRLEASCPFVHIHRAKLRARLGDAQGAISDFNREVELHPGNGYALLERGEFLANLGETASAKRDLHAASEIFKRKDDEEGLRRVLLVKA